MSLASKITSRLHRRDKRSKEDGDRSSPVVQDRPMGGSGDDYRDYQASLDHNRISGGPPMSGF